MNWAKLITAIVSRFFYKYLEFINMKIFYLLIYLYILIIITAVEKQKKIQIHSVKLSTENF